MKKDTFLKDPEFMRLIKELQRIEESNDSFDMTHNYGRLYNDAMNHLVVVHQIDGEEAMSIIDRLVKDYEKEREEPKTMEELDIKDEIVITGEYRNNKEIKKLYLTNAKTIYSEGKFAGCESLEKVYFGMPISNIGSLSFANCDSLTDVWFPIIDENQKIDIAENAFEGCKKQITFHIFASAVKNKSLNDYANRHGFLVVGMI